ncbi:MAG: membrane dipeptidase [Pedosphaera sp.]|nr:membrane dipeptidase [Pedosphaera sp.]
MQTHSRRSFLRTSALAAPFLFLPKLRAAEPWEANEVIQKHRRAALAVLKPTKAQLDRGLKLHAESLVFDTYGFAPRCAVDGKALAKLASENASAIEIKDARERMMMTRCVDNAAEREEFQQAWKAAGVTCIFQNAGEEGQAPMRLIKRLANFTYVTDHLKGFLNKAATPADITAAKKAGRHCLYFTGNGVPLTQQWISVPDEMRYLMVFKNLGMRMLHLTYNRRNMIGDGCAEPGNAGLSDFGKSVVKEMNRLGVIPDCAHSGWQTSLEAAQVSGKPVLASHSCAADLHKHIRGKPDKVLKAIADTGGLTGIACIPSFLGNPGNINAFLSHIDHVIKTTNINHVGIGSDVAYMSRNQAAEAAKIPKLARTRTAWRYFWPVGSLRPQPQARLSIAWTNWPLFTVGLVQRGYKDEEIRKIIGGNMLRVCRDSLK